MTVRIAFQEAGGAAARSPFLENAWMLRAEMHKSLQEWLENVPLSKGTEKAAAVGC